MKPLKPAHSAILPLAVLREVIDNLVAHDNHTLAETVARAGGSDYSETERKLADAYRQAAQFDSGVEIDDDASISMGDEDGAYVQAWVWVSDDKLPPEVAVLI